MARTAKRNVKTVAKTVSAAPATLSAGINVQRDAQNDVAKFVANGGAIQTIAPAVDKIDARVAAKLGWLNDKPSVSAPSAQNDPVADKNYSAMLDAKSGKIVIVIDAVKCATRQSGKPVVWATRRGQLFIDVASGAGYMNSDTIELGGRSYRIKLQLSAEPNRVDVSRAGFNDAAITALDAAESSKKK